MLTMKSMEQMYYNCPMDFHCFDYVVGLFVFNQEHSFSELLFLFFFF